LDVNVFVPVSHAQEVFDALPDQIAVDEQSHVDTVDRGQVRLWWEDTAVDVFFSYHEFHDHAAARTRSVPFEGIEIPVLDCTDLAVLKALFDRTKDWADIEAMADIGAIDEGEAKTWLGVLLGTESSRFRRFSSVLSGKRGADALRGILDSSDGGKGEG
jgi:hypothetical protein